MKIRQFGLIALLVLAIPASQSWGADESSSSDKSSAKKALASLKLDESYPEGPGQPGIFGDLSPNLAKMIERIDKAAADDKVFGIMIHFDSAELGRGKVDELRAAVLRARKAGKKVYAELNESTSAGYILACACDEIAMPPVGMLTVAGVRMEITYFKNLLEKLGIKADMLQVGDYKGAAEPLTRENMSPEFRKQTETVIDDYYQQLIETISKDRKLDVGKVKDLIDEGLFTAQRAKEVGLIDHVAYGDEFRKRVAQEEHIDDPKVITDYGKKQLEEEDFSGFAGFMKMIELLSGGDQRTRESGNQKIAIVYAVGPISSGESRESILGESSVGSDSIVKALREAEENSKVAAIVLRVDSPGGSALASDLMWREITRIKAKKPVLASMGDIAASGGYYISMGCTKIFAEPGTLTGSIGVVSGKLAMKGLYDKIGITTDVISRGRNSGWMSSDEPYTTGEREVVTRLMQDCYRQFTEKAAAGRNMPVKQLESLASGRLYTGRMAKQCKLVDELGTLDDAIAAAKKMAGIKEDEKVERLILPKPRSFLEGIFGGPLVASQVKSFAHSLLGPLQQAEAAVHLFREPAVLIAPVHIRVK